MGRSALRYLDDLHHRNPKEHLTTDPKGPRAGATFGAITPLHAVAAFMVPAGLAAGAALAPTAATDAAGAIGIAMIALSARIPGLRSTLLAAAVACVLLALGHMVPPSTAWWWASGASAWLAWLAIAVTAALVWHGKRLGARHDLAQHHLVRREEQLRQCIDSSPAGMLLVDATGSIVLVNVEAGRLLGYERHALEGQSVEALVPDFERAGHARHRAGFLAEAGSRRMASGRDVHALHRDGHQLTLDIGLARIDTQDGSFVLATLADVGERRQAALAREGRDLARRLHSAEEEQRKRMAREIHDALGQSLTALKLDIGWLATQLPDEPAHLHEHVIAMEELATATIDDVRRLSAELRPSILDDQGLLAAIRWQVGDFEKRSGLSCTLTLPNDMIDWSAERCTVAFRVLQESLTNVLRHAQARHVAVSLRPRQQGDAVLEVRDDGRGITEVEAARPQALGLLGMRERALLHDGVLTVTGVAGLGTTVTLCMPCGALGSTRPAAHAPAAGREALDPSLPGAGR